ncbi:Fumble domain containing protein [Elaphomyces granulatus]
MKELAELKAEQAKLEKKQLEANLCIHLSIEVHVPKVVYWVYQPTNHHHLRPSGRGHGAVKINVKGAFIVENDSPPSEYLPEGEGVYYERKDIRLPHHTSVVSHVAVDIGGSLAKLVYFTCELDALDHGGRLNFINFETHRIDLCIDFIKQLKQDHEKLNGAAPDDLCVVAMGGGAYNYYDRLKKALDVDILREDEMECLITGLDFFINKIPNEAFTYSESQPMQFTQYRVSGPSKFQRVGSTHLALAMTDRGDNSGVDMLVGDIYGMDYNKIGLKSTDIASSFGKVFRLKRAAEQNAEDGVGLTQSDLEDGPRFNHEDMSRSLLNNIGQIAYLQSEQDQVKHIYFGGSFIRGALFWSKGEKQAYFLRHKGYLGAVGAFLLRQPKNWGRRNSLESAAPFKATRESNPE